VYIDDRQKKQWRELEQIFKRHFSPNCSLKLKSMKRNLS